jgi:hypothetical protein
MASELQSITELPSCPHCGAGEFTVSIRLGASGDVAGGVEVTCKQCRRRLDPEVLKRNTVQVPAAAPAPAPEPEPLPVVETAPPAPRSTALLAAAQPAIYRTNAFRVTGLPVTATARELSRHAEKLRMMEKLGGAPQIPRLLPLDPAPDAEAIREAQQRLHDPERRLVDELFWFWPLGDATADEGTAALARGDADAAAKAWRALERSEAGAVASHNLAVLWHALALDAELLAAGAPLPAAQQQRRDAYWPLALERWSRLFGQEPLWERLRGRVRELDDPRLTVEEVERLRATLPVAVLSIVGELAARAAEAGQLDDAGRLVKLIRESGFPADAVQEALGRAATPLRNRIFALCQAAEPEADADPAHADRVTERLAAQTKPLLEALDGLLSAGHPTREAVHDEVALRLLACQIPYGNQTKNWERSIALLQPAMAVVASASARGRIQTNLDTLQNNLTLGRCFFCGERPTYDPAELEVKMYGNVTRTPTFQGTSVKWQQLTISVPRCQECKQAHGRTETLSTVGGLLGVALGFGACLLHPAAMNDKGCAFAIADFILLLAGAGIGMMLARVGQPKGIKDQSRHVEFGPVKERLAQGWKVGTGPAQ